MREYGKYCVQSWWTSDNLSSSGIRKYATITYKVDAKGQMTKKY